MNNFLHDRQLRIITNRHKKAFLTSWFRVSKHNEKSPRGDAVIHYFAGLARTRIPFDVACEECRVCFNNTYQHIMFHSQVKGFFTSRGCSR